MSLHYVLNGDIVIQLIQLFDKRPFAKCELINSRDACYPFSSIYIRSNGRDAILNPMHLINIYLVAQGKPSNSHFSSIEIDHMCLKGQIQRPLESYTEGGKKWNRQLP